MRMRVRVHEWSNIKYALLGIGLSHGLVDMDVFEILAEANKDHIMTRLENVSKKLYNKDGGHNKFLESINVTISIKAPRYWWQEFDTYRVGMTKQSESTIHTIMKSKLTQEEVDYLKN